MEAIETPIPKKNPLVLSLRISPVGKKGKLSVLNLTIAMRTTTIQVVLSIVNCTGNAVTLQTNARTSNRRSKPRKSDARKTSRR